MRYIPKLEENQPLFFQPLDTLRHPNRRGYNTEVKISPNSPPRRINPGDYDLYGRVVCWVLEDRAKFVQNPHKATMSGTAKVE